MKFDIKLNNRGIISILIVLTSIFWSKINYNIAEESFSVGFPYNYIFYHSTSLPLNRFQFIIPFALEIQVMVFILNIYIVYFIITFLLYIKKFFPFKKEKINKI